MRNVAAVELPSGEPWIPTLKSIILWSYVDLAVEDCVRTSLDRRPSNRLRVAVVLGLVRRRFVRPQPTRRVQVATAHRAHLARAGPGQELHVDHRPDLSREVGPI